jgi:hypothetical protein
VSKFKIDMTAGKTLVELMKSRDERVRLDAGGDLDFPYNARTSLV